MRRNTFSSKTNFRANSVDPDRVLIYLTTTLIYTGTIY